MCKKFGKISNFHLAATSLSANFPFNAIYFCFASFNLKKSVRTFHYRQMFILIVLYLKEEKKNIFGLPATR